MVAWPISRRSPAVGRGSGTLFLSGGRRPTRAETASKLRSYPSPRDACNSRSGSAPAVGSRNLGLWLPPNSAADLDLDARSEAIA